MDICVTQNHIVLFVFHKTGLDHLNNLCEMMEELSRSPHPSIKTAEQGKVFF